jgi:CheY-like chemotaxis protein
MTGLELAQALRADQDLKDIPIVLVSGAQAGIARQKDDLFAAILDKPYSHQNIIDTVQKIVSEGGA